MLWRKHSMKSTSLIRFTDMDENRDDGGVGAVNTRDSYLSTRTSFRMVNGSHHNSTSLSPSDVEKDRGCCASIVYFVQHDHEYSLYCLSTSNPVRRLCRFIVDSKYPFLYFVWIICGWCDDWRYSSAAYSLLSLYTMRSTSHFMDLYCHKTAEIILLCVLISKYWNFVDLLRIYSVRYYCQVECYS